MGFAPDASCPSGEGPAPRELAVIGLVPGSGSSPITVRSEDRSDCWKDESDGNQREDDHA